MRRIALGLCGALALFALAGLARPTMACRYSRPVFTTAPLAIYGERNVRVRVERALMIGARLAALRATVLSDSGMVRRGASIVIVVPPHDTANCYYGGLADGAARTGDGALEGYVVLTAMRELPDTFSGWPASESDRSRYNAFAQGRLRGRWVRPRFAASGEPSE